MEGEPPQEEDFSVIPLVERSTHKVRRRRMCMCMGCARLGRKRDVARDGVDLFFVAVVFVYLS